MIRRKSVVVALATILLAASGCSSKKKSDPAPGPAVTKDTTGGKAAGQVATTTASPDVAPEPIPAASGSVDPTVMRALAIIPDDATVIVGASFTKLLSLPMLHDLAAKVGTSKLPFDIKAECGIDPMTSIRSVTMGLTESGGRGVISGIDKAVLMPCLEKARPKIVAEGGTLTVDGVYAFGTSPKGSFGMAYVDDSTMFVTLSRDGVIDRAALEKMTASTQGSNMSGSTKMLNLLKVVNTDVALWAVASGERITEMAGPAAMILPKTEAVMLSANTTPAGLAIDARLRTGSTDDALGFINGFGGQVAGLKSLASKLDLKADGNDIRLVITATSAQLKRAGKTFSGMLGAALGGALGGGRSGGPAPAPGVAPAPTTP